MELNEIFIKETTGGEKKDGIISMLFDPIYRSMLGANEGMPLVEFIVSIIMDKSLDEVKGKVKHLSKELLKKHYKDMDSHVMSYLIITELKLLSK